MLGMAVSGAVLRLRFWHIPISQPRFARLIELLHQLHVLQKIPVLRGQSIGHIPIDLVPFTGRNQDLTFCRIVGIQFDQTDAMCRKQHAQFFERVLPLDLRRNQIAEVRSRRVPAEDPHDLG